MTDYIKREDAINVFCWDEDLYVKCGIATQNIKDIPSADVRENIKSVWIERELQSLFDGRHTETRCGNCGYEVYKITPFCPNCGADMRQEKNYE